VSDEAVPVPAEPAGHTLREQYFRKSNVDFSGLPSGLKVEMRRLVNRGPTPEMVERVKRKWAAKRG
jgi:hypothetical protein